MIHKIIPLLFLIIMILVSAFLYNHKDKKYRMGKSKKIHTLPGFPIVYRYLQLSTLIINLLAFTTDYIFLCRLHHNLFLLYLGLGIGMIGLFIFVSAKQTLDKSYSPCFDSFAPLELVKTGIYKHIRHPIYMANILILFGLFISNGSIWNLINTGVLATYYVFSAIAEEKVLKEQLEGYVEYSKNTKMFIPKIF